MTKKKKVKRTEPIKVHLEDPIVGRISGAKKQIIQPSTEKEAPMPCNGKKSGGKKPPKK